MRIYEFFLTLVLGFVLVLVVMNKSVFSYIEQKYHIAAFDPSSPLLYTLGTPARALDSVRSKLFPSQEELALNALESSKEPEAIEEVDSSDEVEQVIYPLITQEGKIALEPESTFLFIGDSLMQGVGMTLGLELKKRGFSVIDIAKQSTGLTYIDFFDWGKTLSDAFAKNPHINIVVIMVGANDPYNMPKIKYASAEWVEVYSARIRAILETANAHNAIVVWYEAPIVKKPSLNAKLAFLNTLYAREVASYKAVFLPTNATLAPDGVYTAYGKTQAGKSVKLRANDGIHFSGDGSRVLGGLLLERLEMVDSTSGDSALFGEDWACGLESRISSPRCVDRQPSLISLRGLKSHDSSSTILESQAESENQKSHREQVKLESTFENNAQNFHNLQSPTAIPRILGEENQAKSENQAKREKSAPLESTSTKNAKQAMRSFFRKVDSKKNAQNRETPESTFDKSPSKQCAASLEKWILGIAPILRHCETLRQQWRGNPYKNPLS